MNSESVEPGSDHHQLRDGDITAGVAWQGELDNFAHSLVRVRMLRAFNRDAARYPVFRSIATSVQSDLDDVLDNMALRSGLTAQRLDSKRLLLDERDVFVSVSGRQVPVGSSLTIDIWARTLVRLDAVRARLLSLGGEHVQRSAMFTIDWHFASTHMGLTSVSFDEAAEPELAPQAYPGLREPVSRYVDRYLAARETVLVVMGPPGTGKTRLVRSILTALSRRKGDSAKILYTADKKAVESDEIFVDFVTGTHDAFVIEDADHLLRARSSGNTDLHRFLAIADGVVRAQGRKIVFTTNLPNISDIDEALIRPGRAFDVLRTRLHTPDEARALLQHLRGTQDSDPDESDLSGYQRGISLADIYRLKERTAVCFIDR
jgi:ATPase family associated with various cellular activities (AAA)